MNRKGQTAEEYLGLLVIVCLVAVAIVWAFGGFNPGYPESWNKQGRAVEICQELGMVYVNYKNDSVTCDNATAQIDGYNITTEHSVAVDWDFERIKWEVNRLNLTLCPEQVSKIKDIGDAWSTT